MGKQSKSTTFTSSGKEKTRLLESLAANHRMYPCQLGDFAVVKANGSDIFIPALLNAASIRP